MGRTGSRGKDSQQACRAGGETETRPPTLLVASLWVSSRRPRKWKVDIEMVKG